MIIYRPHRGGLRESMEEAREFESEDQMKEYIVELHTYDALGGPAFGIKDIVIGPKGINPDFRVGWNDVRNVCVKKYFNEDYMIQYGTPQCIGYCSTDYGSLEQSKRMCKEFLEGI